MEKDLQPNLEIQLFSFPTLNPAISSALDGLKSFSPGEVYEFLQHRLPLQSLKSKSHAKTANSMITLLEDLLESADLDRGEITQIKLYQKTLHSFVTEYERSITEEAELVAIPPPAPKKVTFADTFISRLRESAEAERKNVFGMISKSTPEPKDGIVEAKFRKIKRR